MIVVLMEISAQENQALEELEAQQPLLEKRHQSQNFFGAAKRRGPGEVNDTVSHYQRDSSGLNIIGGVIEPEKTPN